MFLIFYYSIFDNQHNLYNNTGGSSNSSVNTKTKSSLTDQTQRRKGKRVVGSTSRRINFTNDEDIENHINRNKFVGISSGNNNKN